MSVQSKKDSSITNKNSQLRTNASMVRGRAITRFAPSPTGVLHIGGARTALFNYLFAKQNNGKFILRIEDTDKERSKKEYEDDIVNGLKWLGLDWDEFCRQSERKEIYKKHLKKLLEENKAYVSENEEGKSKSVIRFKNPNEKISFDDLIRGKIEFDTKELGDFVIAKDENTPLYHFAVVTDDFEMGITHIIRGEDHISNTPRQILIQEAINAPRPLYAHIPLILGPDRSKLSKRHGAASLSEYKELGYLPEAMINFLALLGWNPGDEREIFALAELSKEFSLEKIQKSGAIFNIEKLNWTNSQYIKKMDIKNLMELCMPYMKRITRNEERGKVEKIIQIQRERISKLSEAGEGIDYFFQQPEYGAELLVWKKSNKEDAKKHLENIIKILCDTSEEKIQETIWKYAEEKGKGDVLWPFRVALSGLEKSPDPFAIYDILGKKETLSRIQYAVKKLE